MISYHARDYITIPIPPMRGISGPRAFAWARPMRLRTSLRIRKKSADQAAKDCRLDTHSEGVGSPCTTTTTMAYYYYYYYYYYYRYGQ